MNDVNERYTLGAYVDLAWVNARLVYNHEFDQSNAPVRAGDRDIVFVQAVF